MKTLLLFDIDGTLLRTGGAGRRSIAGAFREVFGVHKSLDGVDVLGRTDPELFQDCARKIIGRQMSGDEYQHVTDRYLSLFASELEMSEEFFLMPGVTKLLQTLSTCGDVVLGLQTGNLEPSAYMKLNRGGIDTYFKFGGFGSDSEDRAQLIRKGIERARRMCDDMISDTNIYIIDDSPYGIRSGKEAGVKTIAVGTGYPSREELEAESPTAFLPDLSDIDTFLHLTGGKAS